MIRNLKKRVLALCIFLLVPCGAPVADGEQDKENLANLLNYAQVSIHTITAFNSRVVLDREYRAIINNFSLRELITIPLECSPNSRPMIC